MNQSKKESIALIQRIFFFLNDKDVQLMTMNPVSSIMMVLTCFFSFSVVRIKILNISRTYRILFICFGIDIVFSADLFGLFDVVDLFIFE